MSDLTDRPLCSTCGFPLDEYNAGLRYFGTHTAHVEWYCAQRMRGTIDAQAKEIEALKDALRFVERWANHHGAKPHITPQEALSVIQHYPPIKEITRSYVDGKVPETPDPYAEIEALRAEVSKLYGWVQSAEQSAGTLQRKLNAAEAEVEALRRPGYVLVPREPTEAMCRAAIFNTAADTGDGDWGATIGNWQAMIDAAMAAQEKT